MFKKIEENLKNFTKEVVYRKKKVHGNAVP